MPIMTLFRSPSIGQQQYDAIVQAMDLQHQPQVGMLSHACGFDKNGICVLDVWESRADFEIFVSTRLKPAFAKLGMAFTEPEVMEAYKFRVAEGVDRYKAGEGPSFGAQREGMAPGGPTLEAEH